MNTTSTPDVTDGVETPNGGSLHPVVRRRFAMCEECPFRDADEKQRQECAAVPPHWFTCHIEDGPNGQSEIQCRGHWEAQRKYGHKPPNAELSHEAGDRDGASGKTQ